MKSLFRSAIAAFICLTLFACSKGNDSPTAIDPRTGKHASDWVVANTGGNHPAVASVSQESCRECHGQDLLGGISKVSCFTASFNGIGCHPNGPGHPAGFSNPDTHGARAKAAAGGVNGLATCKGCHGIDYRGAGSTAKDCIGCHKLSNSTTNAPHSPAPWRGGSRSHTTVHESNASACAQCHTAGANLAPASQVLTSTLRLSPRTSRRCTTAVVPGRTVAPSPTVTSVEVTPVLSPSGTRSMVTPLRARCGARGCAVPGRRSSEPAQQAHEASRPGADS